MAEPVYEVVWPLGKSIYGELSPTPQLPDLSGKTVCELWDWLFKGEEVFPIIRQSLSERYPGIKFVNYSVFGNIRGPKEREVIASLPDALRKHGCDAVISGVGE